MPVLMIIQIGLGAASAWDRHLPGSGVKRVHVVPGVHILIGLIGLPEPVPGPPQLLLNRHIIVGQYP